MDAKLTRTIARFQQKIEDGNYYEAHQTIRTITNRYVKSGDYTSASQILYQTSLTLSEKKQYASSSDLISYLISVYVEGKIYSKDAKLKLIELITNLPDDEKSLTDLSKQALNWSKSDAEDSNVFGDSDLHTLFGTKLLNTINETPDSDKLFSVSELHLILGNHSALPTYINFLFSWFELNSQVDAGLFASRAVINYSYLKNLKFVKESLSLFIDKLKSYNSDFTSIGEVVFFQNYPLINFLQLLVLTIEKKDVGSKFLSLFNEYKPILQDYNLVSQIEYIGKLYFDLNLGNPKQGNMMANLLGDFFK